MRTFTVKPAYFYYLSPLLFDQSSLGQYQGIRLKRRPLLHLRCIAVTARNRHNPSERRKLFLGNVSSEDRP
jgi:hypothetical protein